MSRQFTLLCCCLIFNLLVSGVSGSLSSFSTYLPYWSNSIFVESVEIVTVSMGIILLVYSIADLIDMIVIKKNVNGISRFIKDEVSRFKELD